MKIYNEKQVKKKGPHKLHGVPAIQWLVSGSSSAKDPAPEVRNVVAKKKATDVLLSSAFCPPSVWNSKWGGEVLYNEQGGQTEVS